MPFTSEERFEPRAALAPVERPDELDRSFRYFHDRGTRVTWWERDGGYWVVAGHGLASQVLLDHDGFSSRHDVPNGVTPYLGVMTPPSPLEAPPLELDPPRHTLVRRILRYRFSRNEVERLRPRIEQLTEACLTRQASGGGLDAYYDLAQPVCAGMTLELLGLPADLAPVVADAAQVAAQVGPVMSKKVGAAWLDLIGQIGSAIEDNRRAPGESVIGDLCRSAEEFLTDDYITRIAITLLLGGATSPVKLLADTFKYLGSNESARRSLSADEKLYPTAVEEFLRFFTPTEIIARTVVRDVDLGGKMMHSGDRVVVSFGAANRDPRVFAAPNAIDLRRRPNLHLSMGLGLHRCLGAALGRTEVLIVMSRLLARFPDFGLVSAADESRAELAPLLLRL
jgi:cytochrome P450